MTSTLTTLLTGPHDLAPLGSGALGGKATGLLRLSAALRRVIRDDCNSDTTVEVPPFTVIGTEVFDDFLKFNDLSLQRFENESDERVVHAMKGASLPPRVVGDLRRIAADIRFPLAVRSSSLLEDRAEHPFAGVYGTKMIPCNSPSADVRFDMLIGAVKYVYASMFFKAARQYASSAGVDLADEKMGVIIQAVEGCRRYNRFYPTLSGVARSINFYPPAGRSSNDGVVSLALGLGKTIVAGEQSWSYCPAYPKSPPMYNSSRDLMERSQLGFYAIDMNASPKYAPFDEDEYLVRGDLALAEYDNMLSHIASTYIHESDRINPGIGRKGPRIIDFGPMLTLRDPPLNDIIVALMKSCEDALGAPVEIEFAATLPPKHGSPVSFSCLQVRPLAVNAETVDLPDVDGLENRIFIHSDSVLGNGIVDGIEEIVYIHPKHFDPAASREAALEIERINGMMVAENRPYLLIVVGRLGTSDPWRGIPGDWGRFAGASAMVEVMTGDLCTEFSQGSHFFQNMCSAKTPFFSVTGDAPGGIDWRWLEQLESISARTHVHHVRSSSPLRVMVDGRCNRGLILHHD